MGFDIVTVGAVGAVTVGVTGEKLKVGGGTGVLTLGGVTVGAVTVGAAAVTVTAAGGVIFILGVLNLIASGCLGVAGFLSVIVIVPFTTCFGLTPALTSKATIGSCTGFVVVRPYPLVIPLLLLLLADVLSLPVVSEEYCLLKGDIYLS